MLRMAYSYPTDTLYSLKIAGANFDNDSSVQNLASVIDLDEQLNYLDISNQIGTTRTVTVTFTPATSESAADGLIEVIDNSGSTLVSMATSRTSAIDTIVQ